jgi:predicted metal-dependent hydrolase
MARDPFTRPPMDASELKSKLLRFSDREIELVINQNHSTFLSVLKKGRNTLKISLHKLFLHAGDSVCEAVVDFSMRKDPVALKKIRFFANDYFSKADHSDEVDDDKLRTKGKYYDLVEIYDDINKKYFDNKIDLKITWFKKPKYRTFSSLTFGSYNRTMKLIRINDILDHAAAPTYFVEYVVYHEMLHHVCPGYTDENGREHIHTPLFRKREKEFAHFKRAKEWEKKMSFWKLSFFRAWR